MDVGIDESSWPELPKDLARVGLNLPWTFRLVCADKELKDEDLGRLVRCLALDTDAFSNSAIEADVSMYREILRKKNGCRVRMARFRSKWSEAKPVDNPKAADSTSCKKTTPIPVERTPPIVPLRKKAPSPLESSKPQKHVEAQKIVPKEIQDDLFPATEVPASSIDAVKRPPEALNSEVDKLSTVDLATPPVSVSADSVRNVGVPVTRDRRNDMAWIPEKFATFWEKYPKKVAKKDALKAFTKIIKSQGDVDAFMRRTMASLSWWKEQDSWVRDGGKFIPYPASWLNAGHWDDEVTGSDKPEYLRGDSESDEDLIRRLSGG